MGVLCLLVPRAAWEQLPTCVLTTLLQAARSLDCCTRWSGNLAVSSFT